MQIPSHSFFVLSIIGFFPGASNPADPAGFSHDFVDIKLFYFSISSVEFWRRNSSSTLDSGLLMPVSNDRFFVELCVALCRQYRSRKIFFEKLWHHGRRQWAKGPLFHAWQGCYILSESLKQRSRTWIARSACQGWLFCGKKLKQSTEDSRKRWYASLMNWWKVMIILRCMLRLGTSPSR